MLQHPTKLTQLLGGALLLDMSFVAALVCATRAFGAQAPVASIAVVYFAGAIVGSAVPTPGGLGGIEAAMSFGLISIGVDSGTAVSSVLLYRLATYWLPIPFGWFSLNRLQKDGGDLAATPRHTPSAGDGPHAATDGPGGYRRAMTVRRIMGLETEYGISVPGDPMANPMFLSGQVVSVYAAAQGIRSNQSSWDYAFEDPLRDARGWQLDRQTADPSQLTDVEDPTLANVVLTNGARYYVDHAHPEYSSPEVTLPRDAVTWDRAGDAIALESVRLLAARPGQPPVNLYKNNADGKGQSYGTHENYLMPRRTPFPDIVRHLIPFFVTRQVVCGAGRVGLGVDSRGAGLPDLPARRLLRDRGRARDDAQAPDHQHPRRAARRRRPLPAPARHHRRRQPPRRRDPAQDRHDLARARHDRGRTPHRGLVGPAPGRRAPDASRTTRRSRPRSSSSTAAQ